jgi:uncharacterized membrane protein
MANERVTYKNLTDTINEFRKEMNIRFDNIENGYVRQEEFKPVKSIAYGLVTLIMGAVIGTLLKLVIFAK